jgi:hypothetical protein
MHAWSLPRCRDKRLRTRIAEARRLACEGPLFLAEERRSSRDSPSWIYPLMSGEASEEGVVRPLGTGYVVRWPWPLKMELPPSLLLQ